MEIKRVCALMSMFALSQVTHAVDLQPTGVFVEGGMAKHDTYSVGAGLLWAWSWRREIASGQLSGSTEIHVSDWNARDARDARERKSFIQLGLLPLVRLSLANGNSPWFIEAGIGVTMMDRIYRTHDKEFSTRFNFMEAAGVGLGFGAQRRQELSLRFAHTSNANIKKPNPGEDFLQLRYAVTF